MSRCDASAALGKYLMRDSVCVCACCLCLMCTRLCALELTVEVINRDLTDPSAASAWGKGITRERRKDFNVHHDCVLILSLLTMTSSKCVCVCVIAAVLH